jgi:alkylhydroperoxidase/carboxymuconolactone decarboxylase family protein YurZ
MVKEWLKNKNDFENFDVRALKGNFLQAILIKAKQIPKGGGITIIQNFEPIPLYSSMENLGYDHYTEKDSDNLYYCYFYRKEEIEKDDKELPLKPIVIPRYADIDPKIADLTVNFWDNIWNKDNPAIELKTKLLISLSNAVGLGRIRQSTRELVKAYYLGVTTEQFEELFALLIWNQGIGHFSSELAQSSLFKAFMVIKDLEKKGKKRNEILSVLSEKFGEKNPETGFNG